MSIFLFWGLPPEVLRKRLLTKVVPEKIGVPHVTYYRVCMQYLENVGTVRTLYFDLEWGRPKEILNF